VTTPDVDPTWIRLPGTDAGAYYRVETDVVIAVPRPGFVQSAEAANASLEALDRIARAAGRKQSVIVLLNQVASQDAASRRVWSRDRSGETRVAQALVCSTLLGRAIGSFFLGLSQAAVPTRMFGDLESALTWARRMAVERGGAL
jgi:hypothetical protein